MYKTKWKAKTKTVVCYVLLIAVLLWLIASTVDVWKGGKGKWGFWYLCGNHATETICTVTACEMSQGDCYYTVFVEDCNGNQWAYYDDVYREKGTQLCVSFNGNEITDAKENAK